MVTKTVNYFLYLCKGCIIYQRIKFGSPCAGWSIYEIHFVSVKIFLQSGFLMYFKPQKSTLTCFVFSDCISK